MAAFRYTTRQMSTHYTSETVPRLWHLLWNGPARTQREEDQTLMDIAHVQQHLELKIPKNYERARYVIKLLTLPNPPLQMPHLAFRFVLPELHWSQSSSNPTLPIQFSTEYHLQRREPVELSVQADFFAENTRVALMVLFFPELIDNYSHALHMLLNDLHRPQLAPQLTHEKGNIKLQEHFLHPGLPYQAPRSPDRGELPARELYPYWITWEKPLPRPRAARRAQDRKQIAPSLVPA